MTTETVQRERETFRNQVVAMAWLAEHCKRWTDDGYAIKTAIVMRTSASRPEWSVSIEVIR